ncbi:MAG: imidazole glycerol phosphate synthase subunit HisH [Fidelibacterota bacterium]|nr:MAG: imidazole glycerol phosphate synthase subunit HisH [Candidatus Neomarinimicrobiota bacterium]
MIGMIDYGVGNVGSLGNALRYLELPFVLSADPDELDRCEQLILPGVGAFGPAIERLRNCNLDGFLLEWAASGKPLLGICLGMQLLLSASRERGQYDGLGLIPGQVRKIEGAPREVHMGWNEVIPRRENYLVPRSGYAYFVHSYRCILDDLTIVIADTSYGGLLAAAIQKDNILGVQFHPEKSQEYGLDILQRFADGKF